MVFDLFQRGDRFAHFGDVFHFAVFHLYADGRRTGAVDGVLHRAVRKEILRVTARGARFRQRRTHLGHHVVGKRHVLQQDLEQAPVEDAFAKL